MNISTERLLTRNFWLYGGMKIFTKRVFLPLVAIYLVEVGGLTLQQIALIATLFAVVSIGAEVPTGYFADRITRKASLTASAVLLMTMSVILALFPSFTGAILATIFEATGYAFLTGAAEALIHDTLVQQKREKAYTKIVARAQSIGLVGNIVLVAVVSATYKINPHLPFVLSIFAYGSLLGFVILLCEPPRARAVSEIHPMKDLLTSLRLFINRRTFLIFLAIGLISGFYNGSSDFVNLAFKDLGMAPSLLGVLFSASSAVAVIVSFNASFLKRMPLKYYQMFDLVLVTSMLIGIGLTKSLYFAIPAFLATVGFRRLRNIVYQHHLLDMFPGVKNKATLISTSSLFGRLNEVWLPLSFGYVIHRFGYYDGFVFISVIFLILVALVIIASDKNLQRSVKSYNDRR